MAKLNYELGFDNIKVKNYILDPAKSKKVLIERYKFRMKAFVVKGFKFLLKDRWYSFLKNIYK
jgi:hypothetical protein